MPSAGQTIRAADFPVAVSDLEGTSGTTTSTTYTPTLTGGTACGLTFVAPTSGRVMVFNAARMVNNGANETYCGWFMRTGSSIGSGSTVVSAQDDRSILHTGTAFTRMGTSYLATGLTPGSTYNVQQEFRVGAGTGSYANKDLTVIPTT
jgi:hypothetical protein